MFELGKVHVSVFIAISLDGFIAREDGDISWLEKVDPLEEGEDAGFWEFFAKVDSLVMGRRSFEKVLEFESWPYGSKPVIVMSKSLTEPPESLRDRVTITDSEPKEVLMFLNQQGYKSLYLDGGKVIQSFLREGLVDELTITTIPILIGNGLPLFGDLRTDVRLRLLESRTWSNGFVQSKYQVVK